jgi:hypothetical protein
MVLKDLWPWSNRSGKGDEKLEGVGISVGQVFPPPILKALFFYLYSESLQPFRVEVTVAWPRHITWVRGSCRDNMVGRHAEQPSKDERHVVFCKLLVR